MCLPAAAVPAVSLAVSAISTGYGMYAGQQQANAQAENARRQQEQANQALAQQRVNDQIAYNQQVEQARRARQGQILQHQGAVRAGEAAYKAYGKQIANIQDASNRKYRTEQLKLKEARDAQAFKTEEIYAKMIGAQGKVLAQGQTGQSIGAQVNDAARQAGFATAKESATFESKATQAALAMEDTSIQEESSMNTAWNALPAPVQAPILSQDPGGGSYTGSLGIPTYNWS